MVKKTIHRVTRRSALLESQMLPHLTSIFDVSIIFFIYDAGYEVRGTGHEVRGPRYEARRMRYRVRGTKYFCLVF
jgi:hypothetical protein